MKKLLALVLALVMTLGLATVGANAATYSDADSITYKEAVDVMSAIKVLDGQDGKFNPQGTLTREAGAKIIAYMLLGKAGGDALSTSASPFADVANERWSAGAIAYCASQGIIGGVGKNADGKDLFNPEGSLTGAAFAKMLLCALGYDAKREGLTGGDYILNTIRLVNEINLAEDLGTLGYSEAITREQAAQLGFNTLTADMVAYTGALTVDKSGNFANERAVVGNNTYSMYSDGAGAAADAAALAAGTGTMQFAENYFSTLKLVVADNKFGEDTDYWYIGTSRTDYLKTDDKMAVEIEASTSNVLATYTTGIENITLGDLYNLTGKTTALNVYENGDLATTANWFAGAATVTPAQYSTAKPFAAAKGATIKVIDENGTVKVFIEYPYIAKVTKVTDATSTNDRYITMTVYNDDNTTVVPSTGVEYKTENFAKGDYVLVYVADNHTKTEAYTHSTGTTLDSKIFKVEAAETVNGKVTAYTGTNGASVTSLTVDGTKYTIAGDDLATLGLTGTQLVSDSTFTFTADYTLVLSNGYVLGVAGEAGSATTAMSDVVYVTRATYASSDLGIPTNMVECVTLDGTIERVANDMDADGTSDTTAYDYGKGSNAALSAGFYTRTKNTGKDSYSFEKLADATGTEVKNAAAPYIGTTALNGAVNMTTSTTSVTVDSTNTWVRDKAYINSATKLLFVSGTASGLTASVATGAMRQTLPDDSVVIVSRDSANNAIAELILIAQKQVSLDGTIVFVSGTQAGTNENGKTFNMYDIETGDKTEVTVTADPTTGFATYSVNDKGLYTFTPVSYGVSNGDGQYVLTGATKTLYNSSLLSNGIATNKMTDLPAADAPVTNLTTTKADTTISEIVNDTTVTAYALVKEKAVTSIFVTDEAANLFTTNSTLISTTATVTGIYDDGDTGNATKQLLTTPGAVTVTANQGAASTIAAAASTASGAVAADDTATISLTLANQFQTVTIHSDSTAGKIAVSQNGTSVVVTINASGANTWGNTYKITVTAADGATTADYTITMANNTVS